MLAGCKVLFGGDLLATHRYVINSKIIRIWTYLKLRNEKIYGTLCNLPKPHHQVTVIIDSQQGETCWPFRFKLMSNIKEIRLSKYMNLLRQIFTHFQLNGETSLVHKNTPNFSEWLTNF